MGLFDKKNCDICGDKIGLLGNRKLDDGNLCKNCAAKLSPWFEERRHSTVEEIKRQLTTEKRIKMRFETSILHANLPETDIMCSLMRPRDCLPWHAG